MPYLDLSPFLAIVAQRVDEYLGQYVYSSESVLLFFAQRNTMMSASIDLNTLFLRWSEPLRSAEMQ